MQFYERNRNLSTLYERNKHAILGTLTKESTPAPKKASVMISISKVCAVSSAILDDMRASASPEEELLEAERVHRAWQDLLVLAWETNMLRKTDAA
ncbi:hypothetical protein DFR52_101331 [Hoeflea marina]|uniref:Uncharacterized protein n=1 Tax=Hoeflea marina TaxID=274592 RepID=A0A317PSE2_9HYPH|nr:hypothetical protein [Hoeflea marina]PWW03645.1 hypothetical protein DFR52_101331 [Hoeflea marina]